MHGSTSAGGGRRYGAPGTAPGDSVLDPFFGSGTVGVVGCALGRHVIGVELNPDYVALARQRLAATSEISEHRVASLHAQRGEAAA